ncbi:MAG: hypothetical protein JW816_03925 [Candidatus Buchananbacteria bacterium]|nr:hypothetical protein [Candidatus Buchananbacteria bacterium]
MNKKIVIWLVIIILLVIGFVFFCLVYNSKIISDGFTQRDIAAELRACLPKSDMASHEKCNELLATIKNFNDCVAAGFSIVKSNPPQCATPDDRNFVQQDNISWLQALEAVNNCQVRSVFQSHSLLVNLVLKNGDKLTVIEPKIDDIIKAVNSVKARCGLPIIAIE